MKTIKTAVIVLALLIGLGTAQSAKAGVSFSIGTGDFYLSVGNYDYLPYAYSTYPQYAPPSINFHDVMGDYGSWVAVQPFGQVWRPYADAGWRPYVNGHWINTSYGMTWSGYEPWAWAGYHYGNWIYTREFGWAWVPGYDWHPGRVAWSQGSGTIGWSPLPPNGYDYSRGYLTYRGQNNQYTYNDPDFNDYDNSNQYYGGPYYDSGYRDMYYNSGYQNVSANLCVFIVRNNFGYDNYADYYLDRDYTQNVFQRRMVRISSRPLQAEQVERIVKQPIRRVDVDEREIQTDRQKIKVIIPRGEEDNVRKNANKTVREVIAPAFAEKHKTFKGEKAQNERALAKVFRQENRQAKVETVDSDQLVKQVRQEREVKQQKRQQITKQEVDQVVNIEKQAKPPKNRKSNDAENKQQPGPATTTPDINKDRQFDKNRPDSNDRQQQQNSDRDVQRQREKDIEQQRQRDIQSQKQRDFDQQRQKDIENQKQRDVDQQKQNDIQNQKQRDQDIEKQRQRDNFDQQRQRDLEKQKQRDIEQQKQHDFDQQRQRDADQQRQRDIEQQKQRDLDKQRQPEMDQQRQREIDQQRQKDREQPNDQELKKQSDRERDADKQKQQDEETSKAKQKDKDKDKKKQTQTKPNDKPDKDDNKNRNRS